MNDPIRFGLAGNAVFTVESTSTGNRFTFKVRKPDDTKPHFVSVLTALNNESDYAFPGTVFTPERYHHGRRSRVAQDAPSAKAFERLIRQLSSGHPLRPQVRLCHCGKCGRCGKTLSGWSHLDLRHPGALIVRQLAEA